MIVTRGLGGKGLLVAFGLGLHPLVAAVRAVKRVYVSAFTAVQEVVVRTSMHILTVGSDSSRVHPLTRTYRTPMRTYADVVNVSSWDAQVTVTDRTDRYNAFSPESRVSVKARRK